MKNFIIVIALALAFMSVLSFGKDEKETGVVKKPTAAKKGKEKRFEAQDPNYFAECSTACRAKLNQCKIDCSLGNLSSDAVRKVCEKSCTKKSEECQKGCNR